MLSVESDARSVAVGAIGAPREAVGIGSGARHLFAVEATRRVDLCGFKVIHIRHGRHGWRWRSGGELYERLEPVGV